MPRIEKPKIRIQRGARRETVGIQLDLEKLLAAAVLLQAEFIRALAPELLAAARQAFARGVGLAQLSTVDFQLLNSHAARVAALFVAAQVLGVVQVRRSADLPLPGESRAQSRELSFAEELEKIAPQRAIEYLRSLPVLSRAQWEAAIRANLPAGFRMAGVESQTVLRQMQELIVRSLESGLTPQQFDRAAGELLRNYQISASRLRTVWNTNVGTSLARGREQALADPRVASVLTWRLYDAMNDLYVRENHAALDNAVAPAEWWEGPGAEFKPLRGYNCRCVLLGITETRARKLIEQGYRDLSVEGVPADAWPAQEWGRAA
jgi:hypothetical protein